MNEGIITGTITQNNKKVAFVGDGFKFTFISFDEDIILDTDDYGYVWGRTNDHKVIAIFVKRSIRIRHTMIINTWNYILSLSERNSTFDSMKTFLGIRFENGAIRTVFPCNALREDFAVEDKVKKEENRKILAYEQSPDSMEFHISAHDFEGIKKVDAEKYRDVDCTWRFASKIEQQTSVAEGVVLSNTTSVLDIIFESSKDYKTFYDYFGYVRTILSFMIFRKEVGFEKVFLLQEYPQKGMLNAFAECFVKNPDITEERRSFYDVISAWALSEDIFKHILISTVLHDGKYGRGEYAALPINILPTSKKEILISTPEKIKELCSSLEVELDAAKINLERTNELNELTENVKSIVKAHRDGNNCLDKGTYDQIFGSIKHWGDSLTDRINKAWNMYRQELGPFIIQSGLILNTDNMDEHILELVQTRNAITHSGFFDYDEEVGETAFIMYGLIYALALVRMGFQREYVKDLMIRRFII